MHTPHSRGSRGGRRGDPPHGWRGPPETRTPLPRTHATASPLLSAADTASGSWQVGTVRQGGHMLMAPMQKQWHSNLLLPREVNGQTNTKMLA